MGRKRMAHRVASGALGDGCFSDGILELALQREFMEVVPGDATGARMWTERGRGEEILPWPLAGGIGPFAK